MPIHLSNLLPLVKPHVPDCPPFTIEQMARGVAIDFCEQTLAWRHTATFNVTENRGLLEIPSYATVHKVQKLAWENRDLKPMHHDQIKVMDANNEGEPLYFTFPTPNELVLYPYQDGSVTFTAILKPKDGQRLGDPEFGDGPLQNLYDRVPDFIMENHARAIANGTIAACMLLPRQPFSDPVMAGVHQQMYEAERSRAKTEALAGQADAPLRTTARWF